jgi:hypothetical protein
VLIFTAAATAALAAAPIATQDPNVTLLRVPNGGIQPQAVMDTSGGLHLLYYVGEHMHGDLFYVKSSDSGATWSRPLRVNRQPGAAIAAGTIRGGQIAIGRNGRVHVAWNGSPQTESNGPLNPEAGKRGSPMLYSRLNDAGDAFEPERNLMTHTFGLDGGGAVAADSAGNVYVAWHGKTPGAPAGEAGRQVWIAESHDDGKTFAPEKPAWKEPTGACGCCGLAIFADTKGTLRVLYRSATANVHRDVYLLTSTDRGATFSGHKLHQWDINACPMSSMAFAEGSGRVEGAWETDGQVYFGNLTAANALAIDAPGNGKGRKHPRIAIAPNGNTLLVWTEGTGWNRGGELAWQLFKPDGTTVGDRRTQSGVPAWSFGAVVAKRDGFIVIY